MKQSAAAIVAAALGLALAPGAHSQESAFTPEKVSVKERIDDGPNVLVLDQAWKGPSSINVLGAEDLKMKGNVGPGTVAQMVMGRDGKTLFTTSIYFQRYTYGPTTAVVHEWDVSTLTVRREFEIPNKMAHVESQPALLSLTGDEAYLLAQNATPATSITVVDLAKGAAIAEVPTPGCWGAFPAVSGTKFTSVCGDGTMQSFAFDAGGKFSSPVKSGTIFDPDADPVFTNAARVGENLVFVTYHGKLLVVSDAADAPELVDTIDLTGGVLGRWAPSGSEVITYNAPMNTAFVIMHSGAYDGSHKNGAEEIWAIDMASGKVVGRSPAHHENSLKVTQTNPPMLYGVGEDGNLTAYKVEPGDEVTLISTAEFKELAEFPTLIAVDR